MWLSGSLSALADPSVAYRDRTAKEHSLADVRALDRFLASVEKRAFRIARIAVRNDDDALDIVQDAMLQLARRYSERPEDQWPPLFYRILQNRIHDCRRRRAVRAKVMAWTSVFRSDGEEPQDLIESVPDTGQTANEQLMTAEAMKVLEGALAQLPARQQQAFLLRNLEGMDVAQTATAMGCSEGSVKTHYSRAVHKLREQLGDVW
jgi:RNA polymerase sigma-70 factor (ECF subfamily)